MSQELLGRKERPWWQALKALLPPMAAYWFAMFLGLAMFTGAVLMENNDAEDFMILGVFWVAPALGVVAGQLLAITRIRSMWVLSASLTASIGFFIVFAEYSDDIERWSRATFGGPFGMALFIGGLLFVMYVTAGLWSLRTGRAVLAAWGPLMFVTGSIILTAERRGLDNAWHQGDKWAIWDFVTGPILWAGVGALLLYLMARERQRIARWLTHPRAPAAPFSEAIDGRRFRPLSGLGTILALFSIASALTLCTGVLAPYLWRTGGGDRDGNGGGQGMDGPDTPDVDMPDFPDMSGTEQLVEVLQDAGTAMCSLVTLLFLAILGFLAFGPPIRRFLLLQHLRRPLWPVSPTQRVRLSWRLAEIALADAGIERMPGDTATTLAQRAADHFEDLDLGPLLRCAELTDRVLYGFGISPEDVDYARRTAEMTYQGVWDTLQEGGKVRAVYRWV